MPPSALDTLTRMHIQYPMLFEITNPQTGRKTHGGVIEFTAEEGMVFMPYWMMQNLLISEGQIVVLKSASLKKGTFVKFQAHTSDFLDISDHKAVLEVSLRNYSCLTRGDTIMIPYNGKNYYIDVKDTKPDPAISVIETDVQVDFEAPKDYKEPPPTQRVMNPPSFLTGSSDAPAMTGVSNDQPGAPRRAESDGVFTESNNGFQAFTGGGNTLRGRSVQGDLSNGERGAGGASVHSDRTASATASVSGTNAAAAAAAVPGRKHGTVVGGAEIHNRLAARRAAMKSTSGAGGTSAAAGAAAAATAAGAANANKKEDNAKEDAFKAFSGTARSLK